MSDRPIPPHVIDPRLVVVLAGAASVGTGTPTALERASVPTLAAIAEGGRTGRLRAVAPHLPADATSAHATLLGATLSAGLDPGAVAAAACAIDVAPGERCTIVRVFDHAGDVAPALHVARAVEVIDHQLPQHRVANVRRGNELLVIGPDHPAMPEVAGLELRADPDGYVPERPALDDSTVVVATNGSAILGVARLLGAATIGVDGVRAGRNDPVPARLRVEATRALLSGVARTVVVESAAPLVARRGQPDERTRERAVADVLARLDRELIGPLSAATAWRRGTFIVTADIARLSSGQPTTGDVPLIVAGDREQPTAGTMRRAATDGVLLPPRHSERGVADRPIVTSPFTPPPARDPDAPLRFTRDPSTGVTVPDLAAR